MRVYTVTYGQHPVGMVRAADPASAIEFIGKLCAASSELDKFRARAPRPEEIAEFSGKADEISAKDCFGFLF